MTDVWERRLRRAEELERLWPHAAPILRFFRAVTEFQASGGGGLNGLLDVFERHGPPDLARLARGARGRPLEPGVFGDLCRRCLGPEASRCEPRNEPGRCPGCGGEPAVGVLREDREAETVRRTLVCARCAREWDFPRVLCPACGEEKTEKLPRFTAQEIPWIRVEACDSCGRYLKAVDLSKEPAAEPVVDELASTPLDLLARERGYGKIAPNLAGL